MDRIENRPTGNVVMLDHRRVGPVVLEHPLADPEEAAGALAAYAGRQIDTWPRSTRRPYDTARMAGVAAARDLSSRGYKVVGCYVMAFNDSQGVAWIRVVQPDGAPDVQAIPLELFLTDVDFMVVGQKKELTEQGLSSEVVRALCDRYRANIVKLGPPPPGWVAHGAQCRCVHDGLLRFVGCPREWLEDVADVPREWSSENEAWWEAPEQAVTLEVLPEVVRADTSTFVGATQARAERPPARRGRA